MKKTRLSASPYDKINRNYSLNRSKKALSPVVATALLIVVAVGALVGFQTWFNQYSSSLFTDVEQSGSGDDIAEGINNFQNGNIYFNHKTNDNVTVTQVKVGNTTCDKNITLKQGINKIRGCTGKYSDLKDVVVYTNKGIYENKVFEKSLDIPFICESNNESNGFHNGNGTLSSPYQICNCNQLQNMSNYLSSSYELVDNVDCSATKNWNSGLGFNPVGESGNRFTGNLNGNNFEITDLYINRSSTQEIGLFKNANNPNEKLVEDLTLDNAYIEGDGYVGAFVGKPYSIYLHNVILKNSNIISSDRHVGGLIGASDDEIIINNSLVDNSIINVSGDNVGGLIGTSNQFENIIDSSNVTNSKIIGWRNVGGITSYLKYTKLDRSISKNNIVKGSQNIGGIVGELRQDISSGTVENTTIKTISSNSFGSIGAFTGFTFDYPTISNIEISNVKVYGGKYKTGGIVGQLEGELHNSSIINSIIIGGSEGDSGGVIGRIFNSRIINITIANTQFNSTQSDSGGAFGHLTNSNISQIRSKNNQLHGRNVGGIFGTASNSYINNVSIKNINSYDYAGGIGRVLESSSVINNSYVENITINDTSNYFRAGFISRVIDSQIFNSYTYNTTIIGDRYVSAFAGLTSNSNITNSYSALSNVSGNSDVSALSRGGTFFDSYWDNQTIQFTGSDTTESGFGTPYTTSELQNPTSASGIYANWSSSIWDFGTSSEYPSFSWE